MSVSPPRTFYGYYPLFGAAFDNDGVGAIGAQVIAMIPTVDEWRLVQKTDVYREEFASNPDSLNERQLPLCVVVAGETTSENNLEALFLAMDKRAELAVLALRLFAPGWFVDASLTMRAYTCEGIVHRMVGPYRQAFVGGIPQNGPKTYDLHIHDLTVDSKNIGSVTKFYMIANEYHAGARNSAGDIAIENFHRSYGYCLAGIDRTMFLHTALDAMLGGMSARRIGRLTLECKFLERLTAGLQIAVPSSTTTGFVSSKEASWLDTDGRRIRNALAHGVPASVAHEANETWERMQNIVRFLLHQFLEFSVKWTNQRAGIAAFLGLPESCPPVAAYNRLLEIAAHGSSEADKWLRPIFGIRGT